MDLLVAMPTSAAGGHHALYGLAIAEAAQHRGWCVDLATPTFQLDHPVGRELTRVVAAARGELIDIPYVGPRSNGVAGLLDEQVRRWLGLRIADRRAARRRRHDIAFAADADGWFIPCCLVGMPIRSMPVATIMLRITHHHGRPERGAAYSVPRARLQRAAMTSFLRCSALSAVLTPDRTMVKYYSQFDDEYARKVRYVPDMGQMVRPLDQQRAKGAIGVQEQKRAVLCAGYLSRRKGVQELVAALSDRACAESVAAVLMGPADAETSAWLTSDVPQTLTRSGRLVVQLGAYDGAKLAQALSASDGVWLGYRDHFGSSSVLWEAVLAGLPVLGCDTGVIASEIRDNCLGDTVNIDSPTDVALALRRLLFDADARERWKANAARCGAEHTSTALGEGVVEVLQSAVPRAAHGRGAERWRPKQL